ncbi:helix-turn-helix transcriptional regulator [Haladaptatus salinisoli]|uniref:helix-turn-helix transcriptional regulator n=1 Tax=Haladaptatus salinisoli TaxID=2884876 RepID=UPI001D0AE8F2|nr:transcriptional regulator FilR1 domain-containing protein [Haladaptatus salinisoli]
MNDHPSLIVSILQSHVRTTALLALADGCDSTQSLIDQNTASKSAVYNALTWLHEHELIYNPSSKRWSLTGAGQIVVNEIDQHRQTESLLEADIDYWQSHDVTALPPRFRLRLSDLAGGEVVRATETRPARAVSEVERRLKNADVIGATVPVYNDRLADAANDADVTRLVFNEAVFEEVIKETASAQLDVTEMIRVSDVAIAVTVTEDCLLLSLPTLDGTYDSQTEFIAETDEARHWGNDLLDFYWNSAQSPDRDSSRQK